MSNRSITIKNAHIFYRNFSGKNDKFNKDTNKRNFRVRIDDPDFAKRLMDDGWAVHVREPREDGDEPSYSMKVQIGGVREGRLPSIYMVIPDPTGATPGKKRRLDLDTMGELDNADIINVDMIIDPYHWSLSNGREGIAAYLKCIYVTVEYDELAELYSGLTE